MRSFFPRISRLGIDVRFPRFLLGQNRELFNQAVMFPQSFLPVWTHLILQSRLFGSDPLRFVKDGCLVSADRQNSKLACDVFHLGMVSADCCNANVSEGPVRRMGSGVREGPGFPS